MGSRRGGEASPSVTAKLTVTEDGHVVVERDNEDPERKVPRWVNGCTCLHCRLARGEDVDVDGGDCREK